MSEERYFRIIGQNVDLYDHQFVIGDIVLFQEEDDDDSFLLIRLDDETEWWVETQSIEEVFKPKYRKFVKLSDNAVGFKKLIPGYMYEVLFEDEGEWGYIYQVRELLTDNIINCKVSKNRFEMLGGYDALRNTEETKEIVDIVSSSVLDKQEDKGKHYRYSFRLNLTEEDKKNGFVMVNIDPYRISEVYKLGGWREHLVKKGIRGTEKGHSEEELIEELQCTLDRAKQMLEESKE
jgi:hypothetical protein